MFLTTVVGRGAALAWTLVEIYSRGQAKPTNKNGKFLMSEKVTGKRADISKEASAKFQPPLKSRYRENVHIKKSSLKFWPVHQKVPGKIRKIAQSLPFMESNLSIKFRNKITSGSHGKKS